MFTPRKLFFTLFAVFAVVLFAAPMANLDAQRVTRSSSGGSSRASGSGSPGISRAPSGSRSSGSSGISRAPSGSRSSGISRSSGSSSRNSGISRSSGSSSRSPGISRAPSSSRSSGISRSSGSSSRSPGISRAPSTSRTTAPSRSSGSLSRSGTSSTRGVSSLSRPSYRPAPTRTTSSGVPTISRAAPGTSRVADSRSGTAAQRAGTPSVRGNNSVPSLTRAGTSSTRSARATDSVARANDRSVSSRSVISERSTLTSFRGTPADSFRSSATRPTEPLPTTTYRTTSYTPYYSYPSYYPTYTYGWPYYYSGFSIGFNVGSFYIGWNTGWPYYSYWGYNPYAGSFAAAFLVGTAWRIVPYTSLGWVGYYWGGYCTYWPWASWRRYHRYYYQGLYFRVCRPYWYGYTRWYDYSPYRYGYVSLVYDSLYDEGYDDGYDRGYNRGYEDGADDTSAYQDDRRRDEIGSKPRPRVPDSKIDRAKADAAEEYRYEMTRGTEAFSKGDFRNATRAYKEAVILNPDSADARYSLAISAFAEGKFAFAAFALRRGMALDAKAGKIDLAQVFGDPLRLQGYRDALNAELAEYPEDADLLLLSGYVALRTGDAAAAAETLDRALKAAPQDEAAQALQREAMEALENK